MSVASSASVGSSLPLSKNSKWFSVGADSGSPSSSSSGVAPGASTMNGKPQQPPLSATASSRVLHALALENALKYGDEIRLHVRSNYLKKPKPVWLDPEHKGWTQEELKGGYLGVYTKPDKTTRVMVPPLGDHAHGTFRECTFRVEDVFSGQESYGHVVTYGSVVVLVDDQGMVWNNKTGGLFLDGYLSPRPRGTPGEVFISFQKNGKRGEPVQYGDVGVFIDVEDSHRFRVGFNNRLTNYKGQFSSVVGGYVSSDGSGEPLTVVVERFRGKIPTRTIETTPPPSAAVVSGAQVVAAPTVTPNMRSVSVINQGVRSTMKVSPAYSKDILLYNVVEASQVEVALDNGSSILLDGSELLKKKSKRVEVKNRQGYADFLACEWSEISKPTHQVPKGTVRTRKTVALAAAKLIVAYFLIFAVYLVLMSLLTSAEDAQAFVSGRRGGSSRGFKRARFFAAFVCWLGGLATPAIFFKADDPKHEHSEADKKSDESPSRVDYIIVLKVRFEAGTPPVDLVEVTALPKRQETSTRVMAHTSSTGNGEASPESIIRPETAMEDVQPWLAAGKDPITGNPLHFAWVRFLNGERGNRETALKRWHITCEWRYENNIDGMLDRSHRLFFLIKAHYPHFYYGRSKWGNPVYIEQVGKVNTKAIRAGGGKLKDMIFHYIYTAEYMWNVLEPTEYGSSLTILDVEGIGFFDFAGEAVEFVKKATAVVQEHYPERGFMVFIINAPMWFTSIWAVVSTWVNPHTRDKIKILGKHYSDELLKAIDKESLPVCYGGTNPRPLADSDEEKMIRNIAIRALLANNDVPIGGDGKPMTRQQLEQMLDPSVDGQMYKSKMMKVAPDGTILCDDKGRPIEKTFH